MLLSAALSLVVSAAAVEIASDAAAPSPQREILDAFPMAGTTLPANAHLLASGSDRFVVTHSDGTVEDLAAAEPSVFMWTRTFRTITPTLIVGDVITLERVCDVCGRDEPLSWPVGDADTAAPAFTAGTPTDAGIVGLYDNDPSPFSQRIGFNVAVWLPALQQSEEIYVHLTGEGLDLDTGSFTSPNDPGPWISFQVQGPDERTACFEAVAIDAAGNNSAPYPFCVDLVDDRTRLPGCSQSGASSTAVFAVAALLLRRRRRRVVGG